MAVIDVHSLCKHYPLPSNPDESFLAVNNVSLRVEAGEIFGILGPNGAGKTSTLEMLEGLSDSDSGSALVPASTCRPTPMK